MGACSSQQNETQKKCFQASDPASGPLGAAHSKCSKCFDTQQQQGAGRGADRRSWAGRRRAPRPSSSVAARRSSCAPPGLSLALDRGGATVHRARGAGRGEEG